MKDKEGSQYRHEEADGSGTVRGSYGFTDDKGIYREVHYIADKHGFRAHVKTNEPGTANQDAADVKIEAHPQYHHSHDHHHAKYIPEVHPVVHKVHIPSIPPAKQYHHINTHSYGSNKYSPIHGFSYKQSSVPKYRPLWNLDDKYSHSIDSDIGSYKIHIPSKYSHNIDSSLGKYKHHIPSKYSHNIDSDLGGYKFHIPHYRKVHGMSGYNRGYGHLHGVEGMNSHEIERIIDEIKKKIQESEGYKGFSDNDFDYNEYRDIGDHKYKSSVGKDYLSDDFDLNL